MNTSTVAANASAPAACPGATYVVSYESANTFVLALSIAGVGLVLSLTTVAAVLVVLVRRLDGLVGTLRKETGGEVRNGLLNGAAKKPAAPPTTSCAEDEDEPM